MYTVCKIELVLSYIAVLCVVLQKGATPTQIYYTVTTSDQVCVQRMFCVHGSSSWCMLGEEKDVPKSVH